MTSFRLDGRAALVTGAASGIGARLAVGLAEVGAQVGWADVDADGWTATIEAIQRAGGSALALPTDVTDADSLAAAVDRIEAELGPLTLAVNSAGGHSTAAGGGGPGARWARSP